MSFVEAENISFAWGASQILREVSLRADTGRFIGIIGPNGSGKSTFLKCIYRVLQPDAGEIRIDGRSIDQQSHRESAQRLAVVAQHNQYDFDFSVLDVVMMGRSPHKRLMERDNAEDFRLVEAALDQVGMSEMRHRAVAALSGGEQQRVILARALAQQTPVLILDEPTNHLDIRYQLQMMSSVRELGKTVIAAFHDLNIAAMYCDEIYVLKAGKVYAHGASQEVLTPTMIQDVYGVRAEVRQDPDGQLCVIFKPQ